MSRAGLSARAATLERKRRPQNRWRTDWNLDALSVEDLEALMPLAEKQAREGSPAWTAEEQELLATLGAKARVGEARR